MLVSDIEKVGGWDKDKLNTTQRDIKLIVVVPNDLDLLELNGWLVGRVIHFAPL